MKSTFFAFRSSYSYEQALAFQGVLNAEGYTGLLAFEPAETLLLGRESCFEEDVLVSQEFLQSRDVAMLQADHEGITQYHGPGQLVGFPVGDLKVLFGDPNASKRFAEEMVLGLAHACAVLGVKSVSTRMDQFGLWTNRGQLASVGLLIKDGHPFHGFALNVRESALGGFGLLRGSAQQTSLEAEGVRLDSIESLATKILPYLSVIEGAEVHKRSKTVSYENTHANLVAAVSRSQMAIEHFRSNMESVRNLE